ncbi:VOC family protein [Streptomyces roseoverticillatus]|uniref:VOC family protein n=1 Tax=Streptomyces roseoverticillatus TaxID=66429 RepID=UPI0035AB75FD
MPVRVMSPWWCSCRWAAPSGRRLTKGARPARRWHPGGFAEEHAQDAWFACINPSGVGPRLYFQRVPEGKAAKNRLHLDVRVGTGLVGEERLAALEAECARLVPLGAVHVRTLYDGNDACIPMPDIEGNEFYIG